MPSKLACCLSNLCLAAITLRSQFLLCCVDLSRKSDKLRLKWCLSASDNARAPASNSAVMLKQTSSQALRRVKRFENALSVSLGMLDTN